MKTFNTSADLLKSFTVGQGKTDTLPEIASLEAGYLTYSGITVEVSQVWQDAYLLSNLHRNLKDLAPAKQTEQLKAFSENRLSLNHRFDVTPVAAKPVAGHLLTSDQMLTNYLSAAATVDKVSAIYSVLSKLNSSQTKESIIAGVHEALNYIVTIEQLNSVAALEAKEAGLILARNTLETAGARNVAFISDTTVTCSVGYALAEQLPQLVSATLEHVAGQDKLGVGCLVMTFNLKGE